MSHFSPHLSGRSSLEVDAAPIKLGTSNMRISLIWWMGLVTPTYAKDDADPCPVLEVQGEEGCGKKVLAAWLISTKRQAKGHLRLPVTSMSLVTTLPQKIALYSLR